MFVLEIGWLLLGREVDLVILLVCFSSRGDVGDRLIVANYVQCNMQELKVLG